MKRIISYGEGCRNDLSVNRRQLQAKQEPQAAAAMMLPFGADVSVFVFGGGMMRSVTAGIVLLCLFTACSSTDSLSGGVRVTRDQKEVAGCRLLGDVTSRGGKRDLKRQARQLGGNVAYIFSESVSVSAAGGAKETVAMVYLCSSR